MCRRCGRRKPVPWPSYSPTFRILTTAFLPPGTPPRTQSSLLSGSTATTSMFRTVAVWLPIWPGIFCPLKILAGSADAPTEPGCLMLCEPWLIGPRAKPWRLMVPWKPLPLDVALTWTLSPTSKTSTPMLSPTSPLTSRSSFRYLRGGVSSLANVPALALSTRLDLAAPKQTCTAVYPSSSAVRTAVIRFGSTSITVTPTSVPSSWKAWVICFLRPNTAVAITLRRLYLYVHAGGQVEPLQGIDRARRGLLEVLAGVFVPVGTPDHRVPAALGRQRNGAEYEGPRPLRRLDYRAGSLVYDLVVVCF